MDQCVIVSLKCENLPDILDLMLINGKTTIPKDWDEAQDTASTSYYGEYFQKVELEILNASNLDGVWKQNS